MSLGCSVMVAERWVHKCALFSTPAGTSATTSYICPHCIKQKRVDNPDMEIVKIDKAKRSRRASCLTAP